ncbi:MULTISPECIES: ABC transporter substrate-binding protein [unclassified Mycobacterium]|uniref:ABC transporter substrate-binding protein n=1 Tax=unclassified Mycobacterium TaxID=2642494 RepID=UPI0029C629F7|nr:MULTISPECIES: ABC transporter substrate-binding protein [unclassified Mycobacterium]
MDINFLSLPVEETFYRMLRFREFDAAELSLSSYVLTLPDGPFVAIPVFPSRAFRHSAIYVRADSPLTDPAELSGLTVGVPEYQLTAAVWIRGILQDHYGLDVESVKYRTGGLDEPGRIEKVALDLPPEVDVAPIPPDQTLSTMLLAGQLDAVYSARNPGPYNTSGHGGIRRLFTNSSEVERAYAKQTGIFPIMHTLVVRREVYEEAPWIAQELLTACTASKNQAMGRFQETAALSCMLPWSPEHDDEVRQLLGPDWWAYGVAANETTLGTFLRYSHEQGLAAKLYQPAEIFAAETLERYVV